MTDPQTNRFEVDEQAEEKPPGFRSWRSVYAVVIGTFVFIVALLYLFTRTFA